MKAWVLNKIGDFSLQEVDKPKLSFGDVLVNVKAAGICGSDIPRAYVNGAHKMPLILGHEMAGEVVCAPGPKAHWMGKRVGIFPLIPCMKCTPCKNRKYELCRNYNYLGSRCNGGFAEFVLVPGINIIELPDNVSYENAAMLEPSAVAVHAMRQVNIKDSDTIVVAGLGTIGLLLTMFLLEKYNSDNIYVIGNKPFQKEKAVIAGVKEDHYFDIHSGSPLEWLMDVKGGADIFFECVGKNDNISLGINSLKPEGTICTVGNPHSDMEFDKDTYWKILRNQLTVKGTWNSSFIREKDDDWNYALSSMANGTVNPSMLITHRFSMDNLIDGFEIMRDKKEEYIKIMMTN